MSIINNEHLLTYTDHFDALQTKLKCLNLLGTIFHIHARDIGVNNFHIWHVIDMGISQFESLIISFQEKNHSLESSKTIEEIISVKLITL